MWSVGNFVIVLLALGLGVQAGPAFKKESAKLPSFIKRCHRSDTKLSGCVRDSINALKDRIPMGIPELFLPPLEPLVVPEIKMDQDSGAIYLHSTYKNIHINGLSNFSITDMVVDPQRLKFSMSMSFPNLTMKADYTMKGKIMMMPLMGDGECRANFTDVELKTVIQAEHYKRHGVLHMKVKDIETTYALGNSRIRLENLFNGDNALGNRMNAFLNENWESLSEEVRPLMENAMTEIVRSTTDKLFRSYSYDELMPE